MHRLFAFLMLLALITACDSAPGRAPQASKVPPPAPPPKTNGIPGSWWHPEPGISWQWQLGDDPIDTTLSVDVYDIDLDADQQQVDDLRSRGVRLICYISVGSWEEWRSDASQFPQELLGNNYADWPGEKWLDIRRLDLLAPILRSRFDLCQAKGFDAVEPDNMDIYTNDTGFDISAEDQLQFALWLAQEAHIRGLAIGVKNAPEQATDLVDAFDFAITEDCYDQGWCDQMQLFISAGKPVFAAEYTDTGVDFEAACAWSEEAGYSFLLKHRELDGWLSRCP